MNIYCYERPNCKIIGLNVRARRRVQLQVYDGIAARSFTVAIRKGSGWRTRHLIFHANHVLPYPLGWRGTA